MKRKLLLFLTMLACSIGTWAEEFTVGTGTITINGTSATVNTPLKGDLDNATFSSELTEALANVTTITFSSTSHVGGAGLTKLNTAATSMTTLDLTGVTCETSSTFMVQTSSSLENLIMEDITVQTGGIQFKGLSNLKYAVVTPKNASAVNLEVNGDMTSAAAEAGIITKNVTTSSTWKWKGEISEFETYNQDFTNNAATTTANKLIITGEMDVEDAAVVGKFKDLTTAIRLLDMSGVTLTGDVNDETFPFGANTTLNSVVLPNGLADVNKKWFSGCNELYAAITYNSGATKLCAFVNKQGRLKTAILDAVKGGNTDFATDNSYLDGGMSRPGIKNTVAEIKLSGTLNAVDVSSNNITTINESGHVAYVGEVADSQTDTRTVTEYAAIGGALTDAAGNCPSTLKILDLSDAYFPVYTDMTLSAVGYTNSNLQEVKLPTDSRQTIIPAFMFAGQFAKLFEICIPANYEVIKCKAFGKSGQGFQHIWTTDTNPNVTVDNGIKLEGDETVYKEYQATENQGLSDNVTKTDWGTYTFSANLKLIESYAFSSQTVYIKDVYVLATETPECHVDAFNMYMYVAQSGFSGATVDGIVTRDAYKNGKVWISMLHYPRDCEAPNIQRYTDMGREYSIATGEVDGKGANIYYPTYGEFLRAYTQGTTGYLWNAWDDQHAYGDLVYNPENDNLGWSATKQKNMNDFTLEHPGKNTSANKKFEDATFYDLTLGGNTKPEGMKDYWEVKYGSTLLYPRAKVIKGDEIEGETMQDVDEYGNLLYEECENGDYVKAYIYVEDANGTYKRITNDAGTYTATDEPIDGTEQYYSDENGTTATPKVKADYYILDGEKRIYSDTQIPVIGVTQYYETNSQDAEPVEELTLNGTYYYPTGNKTTEKINTYGNLYGSNMTHLYTEDNGVYTEVFPTLSADWNGKIYYKDGDEYIETSVFVADKTAWYISWDGSTFSEAGQYNNKITIGDGTTTYYYDGPEVDEYLPTNTWSVATASRKLYSYNEWGNPKYTEVTQITFDKTYYYIQSTEPNYVKVSGTTQEYDADQTYYSDNNGTVASPVKFDQTYYVKDITYSYEKLADDETADVTYKRVYSATEYVAYDANEFDEAAGEKRYCPTEVPACVLTYYSYDYRGWHQFVLNAFAANSKLEVTQHRSYLSDNDWWTICLPYDLTYSEMMFFYGTTKTNSDGSLTLDETKVPYLSQLVNVVRDMSAGTIALNFSKNLMNHAQTSDDNGYWTVSDEEDETIKEDDKVVLHAGVPYMIRPYRTAAEGGSFVTQFDIYGNDDIDKDFSDWRKAYKSQSLYDKLKKAEALGGTEQMDMVKKGLVTVPALVANADATGAEFTEETGSSEMTYTYNNTSKTYPISADFDYTFVGSFYKSFIPEFSYYLGYQNGAKFFYADEPKTVQKTINGKDVYQYIYNEMFWNNNTCVIVPNMLSSSFTRTYNLHKGSHDGSVKKASGSGADMTPAQWLIKGTNDDLKANAGAGNAKNYTMVFGVDVDTETTGIKEVQTPETNADAATMKVYTVNGQYVGSSLNGLSKGVYIVNGKKCVVK